MCSEKYGKCPESPINLKSIPASVIFLNNLVTKKGYHLVYHRKYSMQDNKKNVIDHYEIMSSDNVYEDLYINIYNERSNWIPPEDFLFDNDAETMCLEMQERENVEELAEADIIKFDEKYLFMDPLPDDFEIEFFLEVD